MLEKIIKQEQSEDNTWHNITQQTIPAGNGRDLSIVSVTPENREEVKKIVLFAPGYPGDGTKLAQEFGRYIHNRTDKTDGIENRDQVILSILGYTGVLAPVLFGGLDDVYPEIQVPEGKFSFIDAMNALTVAINHYDQLSNPDTIVQKRTKSYEIYVVGHSYGAYFAMQHADNIPKVSRIICINPVADMQDLTTRYRYRKLLHDGIEHGQIKGDLAQLIDEQEELRKDYNPLNIRKDLKKPEPESTVPISVYWGTEDTELLHYHGPQLVKWLESASLDVEGVPIIGGNHNFLDTNDQETQKIPQEQLFKLLYQTIFKSQPNSS
jgi:dienelactone hydrolase